MRDKDILLADCSKYSSDLLFLEIIYVMFILRH